MDYNTSASGNPAATQPAAWQMGQPLALNHANFQLGEGERVAIMGPSGSGKSTLLHVLAGIMKPTAGQVLFRGANIDRIPDAERTRMRRQAFGFVFQSGQLLPELPAIEKRGIAAHARRHGVLAGDRSGRHVAGTHGIATI